MYQIVCDSVEQETLAYGEESFLNNLVKTFKLPALTLALGRGLAACCWLSDSCGGRTLGGDKLKSTQSRSKGILGLHRAGERGMELPSPLPLPLLSIQMEQCGNPAVIYPNVCLASTGIWERGLTPHSKRCKSGKERPRHSSSDPFVLGSSPGIYLTVLSPQNNSTVFP